MYLPCDAAMDKFLRNQLGMGEFSVIFVECAISAVLLAR